VDTLAVMRDRYRVGKLVLADAGGFQGRKVPAARLGVKETRRGGYGTVYLVYPEKAMPYVLFDGNEHAGPGENAGVFRF